MDQVPEQLPDWAPEGVDLTRASAARMYDYYLGGAHNFAVDREIAAQTLVLFPDGQMNAQANRAFLHRAVKYLLSQGVRQFIDIGSGIPTAGNVHEIVQAEDPQARVLYVDHDPVAVAHSELILGDNPHVKVLQADLRRPKDILDAPVVAELFDLNQPIGVLMIAVLHFVSDEEGPLDVLAQFRDRVSSGSYLVISSGTDEVRSDEMTKLKDLYRNTKIPITYRSRRQIRDLYEGWTIIEPGVVLVPEWRPDWPDEVGSNPLNTPIAGAVGWKP